jgi:hypothetical protein
MFESEAKRKLEFLKKDYEELKTLYWDLQVAHESSIKTVTAQKEYIEILEKRRALDE